jgi:four helix bundle protein
MPEPVDDLHVLKLAETICDNLWERVVHWGPFARDIVGKHLLEAADSIGANIAEANGRLHFGEKLTFLYDARGSLFETKYWLNRARARELMEAETVQAYASELTELARQLNALLDATRRQRVTDGQTQRAVRDEGSEYVAIDEMLEDLFSADDLVWLSTFDPQINN